MSKHNPEYDFEWCPGCGDFGVKRAIEIAMVDYVNRHEVPMEYNTVVAGIGCSGNLVHLAEGPQPYGFHVIHGRTLPVALGVKMSRPELNVMVVAGDGDFLGIGLEHISPQAARNVDICAVIMDNAVYGLTKGQSSPTTESGVVTVSTPFGKLEESLHPMELYLSMGVSYIASGYSSKPKDLANMISEGMEHPGFAIVHVQSPCTTYNDTYDYLKGDKKKGIEPAAWDIPQDHDPTDRAAAQEILRAGGVPLGVIYRNEERLPFHQSVVEAHQRAKVKSAQEHINSFDL